MCVYVPVSHRSHSKEAGQVLVLGQGDVGQLGLGENITERKKPALVTLPEKIVQVIAGGMHTACLSDNGHVSELNLLFLFKLSFLLTSLQHVFSFPNKQYFSLPPPGLYVWL